MYKFTTTCIALATFGLSASAMAVLPTVALDPATDPAATADTTVANQSAPVTASPVTATTTSPVAPSVQPASNTAVEGQIRKILLTSVVSRDAQGQEVLSPVSAQTKLVSGNVIEYRGYLVNTSPDRIRNMKVTMNIPANMELVSKEDMSPERPYGSIDGVNFQYMPLKTNVGGVLQNIPMASYKAVQWDIPGLGLNEVATVKYRVRVK